MKASTRKQCHLLLSLLGLLALAALPLLAWADETPAEGLLPPPVRQAAKRALGGDDQSKRAYFDGRGIGAAFSPDGKILITTAGYQGMTVWDAVSGRSLGHMNSPNNNQGMTGAFTPDGKRFIVAAGGQGYQTHPVAVWDVVKRERLRSLDDDVNDTPFTALTVAPDGKTLALAAGFGRRGDSLTIALWDLASGDEIGRIAGLVHVDPRRGQQGTALFEALAYSPDGRSLAALLNGRILLVEVATGKQRGELTFATTSPPRQQFQQGLTAGALAFSPDGRMLAAGCEDGAVRRFDLRDGRELAPFPGHKGPVLAVSWSLDGKRLQSYGHDGQFFVWRTGASREWRPKTGALSNGDLEALWDVLRDDDSRDLFGCVQTLAANPAQALPFLSKRLAPAPKGDAARIDRLVADLQKGDYNARRRAVIELRKIGAAAAPALRRLQEKGFYDQLTQRLSVEFASMSPPSEQVRAVRALRVLEQTGNAEARKLLEALAGGAPEAPLTVQAQAALTRLTKPEAAKADSEPEVLWKALAEGESAAAYRAVRALAQRPTTAALLAERIKEVVSKDTFNDDPKRVAKLIGDLGSKTFGIREKADKALGNLGRIAVPALRKALQGQEELETKRRLERLLENALKASPPPEMLRVGRALEALELMNDLASRRALAALGEVQVAWLRAAVGDALRRQGDGKP